MKEVATNDVDVVPEKVMAQKVCTRCHEMKPLAAFSSDKRASTGTQVACKRCQAEIRRQRRDIDIEVRRKWYEQNKEHVKTRNSEYKKRPDVSERRRMNERDRYWLKPDEARQKTAEYTKENRAELTRRARERTHIERMQLLPVYVAKVLGMRLKETPKVLLTMKQEQLAIRRLARQLKKATNETSKDTT